MKQKLLLAAMIAMAVAFLPAGAGAAVNNTHHDMSVYVGGTSAFVCYFCHGIKDTAVTDQGIGTVGNLCWNRCHSATGLAGAGTGGLLPAGPFAGNDNGQTIGTRTTGITVLSTSHGMLLAIPAPDQNTSVSGSNFPHTSGFPTTRLECTSCHNVHTNTYAPFLNKPLSDNTTTASNMLCTTCHAGAAAAPYMRYAFITDVRASQGGHVIEVALDNPAAQGRNTNSRHGRTMALKGNALDYPTPSGAALNAPATHYDTGGHLGNYQAATGDPATTGGRIGCYTCHSAHMPSAINNQLLITRDNGPSNPVAGSTTSPLCITCHGPGPGGSINNPGNTAYYHPANSEAVRPYAYAGTYWGQSVGFSIVVDTTFPGVTPTPPIGNPGSGAGQDAITCVTCHDVHNGIGGQMAIRNLGQAAGRAVCEGCHKGGEGAGTARNSHHKTGTANYEGAPYNYPTASPSWKAANPTMVSLADGLACQDCHVFNGTAHNW